MAIDLWKNVLLKKDKKNIAGSILSKTGYLLGAAIILAVHYFSEVREYPYDAGAYWYEGEVYGLAKFSLYNYSSPLRGYLYPLFIYVIRKVAFVGVGTERKVFCVAVSFLYAFFFIVLIPKIAELMFDIVVPMWSRIIYVTICSVMFRGLIVYPLTDIFGIMLVCFAIYFFLILTQDRVMSKWGQALCAALMGIALGGRTMSDRFIL